MLNVNIINDMTHTINTTEDIFVLMMYFLVIREYFLFNYISKAVNRS